MLFAADLSLFRFFNCSVIPGEWYLEEWRLSRLPDFLSALIKSMRAGIDTPGQRFVFLDVSPRKEMPTHIVWGEQDRVVPVEQALAAHRLLPDGSIELFP